MSLFVVLTERKLLAFAQRRMGPSVMGRNGALQIVLDLFKLLAKDIFIIPRPAATLAPVFLALLYFVQLSFTQNFIFSNNMFLFNNLDGLILYYLVLVLFSNIFLILVGFVSQSKYALIGTLRALVHIISLDIFITITYAILILNSQSPNFHDFSIIQSSYWYFFLYLPLAGSYLTIMLLEAKRTPFDHTETEAEVVSGYATEYSGTMLLVFYLAEYLHLIIAGSHFTICFVGGWYYLTKLSLLPPIFVNPVSFILF
jgi:NADH:ubiquinone oxidoreductase subunit H